MAGVPEIHRTEVDGVRTLWQRSDGPLVAILLFRVGHADETLATSGITHLVEHLALYPIGRDRIAQTFNGQVEQTLTSFLVQGDEPAVVDFLLGVTRNLHALPVERWDVEMKVLLAEAQQRHLSDAAGSMLRWRYGARTYGIPSYPEHGLRRLDVAQAQAWAADRFGRQNAVLAINGPLPAGLRLELPDGLWHDTPAPSSALAQTPAWYGEGAGASLLARVERSSAATALRHVLEATVTTDLRYARGASYSPTVVYERLDRSDAHLALYADAVEGHEKEVADCVLTYLDQIVDGRLPDGVLDDWRNQMRDAVDAPGYGTSRLVHRARDETVRLFLPDDEELTAEAAATGPAEVARAAASARSAALFRLPAGSPPVAGMAAADAWSRPDVTGRRHVGVGSNAGPQNGVLVVGDEGLMRTWGGTRRVTVRFEDVAVVLAWPGGRRGLVGADAFYLDVEPALWRDGDGATRAVDRHVDPSLVVAMSGQPESTGPPPVPHREPVAGWLQVLGWGAAALLGVGVSFAVMQVAPLAVAALCGWQVRRSWHLLGVERFRRGLPGRPRPPRPQG